MHIKKLPILCMAIILLFSCFSSTHAIEKDRITMATKLAALCYQAKNLYIDLEKFVLPKGENYLSLVSLYGAVHGTECFGYVLETKSKVYIVFRGSETYSDILRDFLIWKTPFTYVPGAGNVHKGFCSIYTDTSKQQPVSLRDQIMGVLKRFGPEKQLVITGFSLGGALATLCACDAAENSQFKEPIVYTFASPRVGDQAFVDAYNKRIHTNVRVINYYDYVPCNPLHWLGYRHVKGEVILNVDTGRIDRNHRMDSAYFPGLVASVPEHNGQIMKKYADLGPDLPKELPKASWEDQEGSESKESESNEGAESKVSDEGAESDENQAKAS